MSRPTTRRGFLRTAAAGGAFAGLGDLGFIGRLRPLSAAETKLEPGKVQFQPEIEPLVRLLEDTPREKLLAAVAGKIHGGTTYPEILAALQLAGIRNVQPRPSVGFKFHAVLVVNSAHLASLSSPDEHRSSPQARMMSGCPRDSEPWMSRKYLVGRSRPPPRRASGPRPRLDV